ncbi:hypothetical protein ACOMHN_012366 [Nucella lapillus]
MFCCHGQSIKDQSKRLEVRYRPEDLYSKPTCGTQYEATGLVLRVRRRKRQTTPAARGDGTAVSAAASSVPGDVGGHLADGYEYKVEILGTVSKAIKFQGMCDFQYMPVVRKADGAYENVLDKLVMTSFTSEEDFMARKAPLFLCPMMFSRFDTPQDYGFLLKKRKKEGTTTQPVETFCSERKVREKFTTVISFTDPTPRKASETCLTYVQKFKETGLLDTLQELFEERPIWSRAALLYRLRQSPKMARHLKEALPSFAYFFLTGPWRTFWVKMGYDPRKDPSAKKFQGVDFRRQQGPGDKRKIPLTSKKKDFYRKKDIASEINLTFLKGDSTADTEDNNEPKLRDFEFHADVLPPYRQMVYMVCDIFDAEVQALLAKNDGKETRCDERNGWCVTSFADRCRSVMSRHVAKLIPNQIPLHKKYATKKKRQLQKVWESSDEDDSVSMDTTVLEDSTLNS